MANTFAQAISASNVDWKTLHKHYNPLLHLVRELIGIIPNCDPVLEIWPTGFRTYNLLVPNMFNLPNTLFGKKSFKASMGLAMYASSKAACSYCTAHACSFALRRGASTEAIAGVHTEKEHAVVTLAEGLARVPASLTINDVDAVRKYFSESETELLVFSVSMMGFLNKFMNAMGVELEQEAINDTAELLTTTGWNPGIHARNDYHVTKQGSPQKDNLFTYMKVIRQAPGAVLWEKKWTRGVPSDIAGAGEYLKEHIGYVFPILAPVKEAKVIRTLVTVLRDNLDEEQSATGLKIKMYAGYIFSIVVQNNILINETKNLVAIFDPGMNIETLKHVAELMLVEIPGEVNVCKEFVASIQRQLSISEKDATIILLTLASSYSPAQINDAIIEVVSEKIQPSEIVEIIVWLSVLQLLNRMSSYYLVRKAYNL